jgi:hypothetical protein
VTYDNAKRIERIERVLSDASVFQSKNEPEGRKRQEADGTPF